MNPVWIGVGILSWVALLAYVAIKRRRRKRPDERPVKGNGLASAIIDFFAGWWP